MLLKKEHPLYPPGPGPMQFMVKFFQLRRDPLKVFKKWAEKYGPIYRIRIGIHDAVFVSDSKLVKELFSHVNSTGRASNPVTHYFGRGNGISQGHAWEAQRTFTIRKLRDVGILKSSSEEFLMEGAKALVNFFERRVGQSISGTKVNINKTSLLFFCSVPASHCPQILWMDDWTNAVDALLDLLTKQLKSTPDNWIQIIPDFIDHYLCKIMETTDPTSSFYQQNGVISLEAVISDLLAGGSETSSTTLSFVTMYLILNKEAQCKAQQELDLNVGISLPYTEAIILETLRLSSMAIWSSP
ncbi:Cytochrome P450 2J2 [Orchesella cincta]|uniref:Cytochrome P450 2J2 n=1 Tax=Orchesella cincta TaxID=48709 RepID=A0A1D2M486_ORCCI|nr:Cytochrome P450 2J2 [Orchesella cincta]